MCICVFFVANAQNLSQLEWAQYGLRFSVPDDLNVIQNSEDTFEVDNDSFNVLLNIGEWSDQTDGNALGKALGEYAKNQGLSMDKAEIQEFKGEGLEGICIEGDREKDCGCYALLCNESKHILIFVAITYGNGYEETANNIINSFSFK